MPDATVVLPGDAVSVPLARQWLRLRLAEAGTGVDSIEAAAAVLTELVGNAVEHVNEGPVRVSVALSDESLHCEVTDPSPILPERPAPGAPPHECHGLSLVDALATKWGFEAIAGNGKVVWFEV